MRIGNYDSEAVNILVAVTAETFQETVNIYQNYKGQIQILRHSMTKDLSKKQFHLKFSGEYYEAVISKEGWSIIQNMAILEEATEVAQHEYFSLPKKPAHDRKNHLKLKKKKKSPSCS